MAVTQATGRAPQWSQPGWCWEPKGSGRATDLLHSESLGALVLQAADTTEHTLLCGKEEATQTKGHLTFLLKHPFESGLFPNLWQVDTKASPNVGRPHKLFVGSTQSTCLSG